MGLTGSQWWGMAGWSHFEQNAINISWMGGEYGWRLVWNDIPFDIHQMPKLAMSLILELQCCSFLSLPIGIHRKGLTCTVSRWTTCNILYTRGVETNEYKINNADVMWLNNWHIWGSIMTEYTITSLVLMSVASTCGRIQPFSQYILYTVQFRIQRVWL